MDVQGTAVLFAPRSLAIMTESVDGLFSSNRLQVCYRSRNSASLILENQTSGEITSLVLDLAASVERQKKDLDDAGNFSSFHYDYARHGVFLSFEVTPWWWQGDNDEYKMDREGKPAPEEDANDSINALEYVFSQFAYALFTAARAGTSSSVRDSEGSSAAGGDSMEGEGEEVALSESEKTNTHVVASAFEIAGKGVRKGLMYSGRGVGTAIRFLGAGYTSAAVNLGGAGSGGPREVRESDLAYAQQQQENCETFHAGARSVTGTILAPVRYIGMKAQALAPDQKTSTFEEIGNKDGVSADGDRGSGSQSHQKGAGEQILWGMGNGFVHAFKGITEFVSEIGEAVGDSALHHSSVVNGEDYAQRVTKKHVEGAGQVGLGLYKVGNVFTFGVAGIAADAVFEGGVLLTALYEFLVGPVLLHAYMDVTFPPSTEMQRVYVVLRPWSVSFYHHSSHFASKPFRVIPTSLLDTIPQLRHRSAPAPVDMGPLENQSNASRAFATGAVSSRASLARLEETNFAGINDGYTAPSSRTITERLTSTRSHIELCTVDCSTALLHPLIEEDGFGDAESSTERALQEWFLELKEACKRVEEVQKQHSGAGEIAIGRRLRMLPRKKVVWVKLGRLVVKRDRSEEEKKERAMSTESDGGAAMEMMPYNFSAVPTEGEGEEEEGVAGMGEETSKNADQRCDTGAAEAAGAAGGGEVTLKDTLTNATIRAAKIRLYPVTAGGFRVAPEEVWSDGARSVTSSKDTPGALEADFGWQQLEMGRAASLDVCASAPDGIANLLLTVKVQTIYGRENAELGRAYVPVKPLLSSALMAGAGAGAGNSSRVEGETEIETDTDRGTNKASAEQEQDQGASLVLKLHRKGHAHKIVGTMHVEVGMADEAEESASV